MVSRTLVDQPVRFAASSYDRRVIAIVCNYARYSSFRASLGDKYDEAKQADVSL